ncbi:NAD(P)-binding protein [Calocera viscosa TUFC12733]|uniref:NAD(P)-binding protein n=1 Tax=Calocera viscosa (strain TUFC12733) TaxID=1330018 RepID=A0A167IC91_CALVF|nr:NAD(P)-binding protein [Calocera viscosa TUFC12733]
MYVRKNHCPLTGRCQQPRVGAWRHPSRDVKISQHTSLPSHTLTQSTMSLPKTQTAYACLKLGSAGIQSKPLPVVDDGGILVKVRGVALNPTDWKHLDKMLSPGQSMGSDFAGDVVAVGKDAEGKGVKVGDAVASFVRGGFAFGDKDNGAFQQYIRHYPEIVWHKPASLSYEAAAALSLAAATAQQAFFIHLGVPKPWSGKTGGPPILIWSGATSVGDAAVQLAVLAGLKVITTASPSNHAYLKALGAAEVFDYADPEVVQKIKAASGGGVTWALDTISEKGSPLLAAQSFAAEGGKIVTLLPVKAEDYPDWPAKVLIERTGIYSALDRANAADYAGLGEWYKHLPSLVEEGKIKPQPLKKVEGGFEGLTEALEYLRSGKVRREKVVLSWE